MPPHFPNDRIEPHAATPMHAFVKSQEKKLLMQKSMPLRTEESSERKDDLPLPSASTGWTIIFVSIAANQDTERLHAQNPPINVWKPNYAKWRQSQKKGSVIPTC